MSASNPEPRASEASGEMTMATDGDGPRSNRPRGISRVWAVALLAVVFTLGGVTGVGFTRAYMLRELRSAMGGPPAEARAHFRLEAMRRRLDLSDEQVQALEVVLRDAEAERDRLMEGCRPGLDELRERTDTRILGVLRPEQRVRFEELGERRGKFRRPRGSGR